MNTKGTEYHRTFNRYGGVDRMPTQAEWDQITKRLGHMPTPAEWAQINLKVNQRQATVPQKSAGSPSGTEKETRKFHAAALIDGSQLREINIWEKEDQDFDRFATPWEKKWSRLVARDNDLALRPVVDNKTTVVGYYGVVAGHRIQIGRPTWLALIYTPEEVLKYHRMYVGNPSLHAEGNLSVYATEWVYYTVLTDNYGQVTSFEFSHKSMNGEAESTALPGVGWLKLLRSGLKIFYSIRNGIRTLMRAPPAPPPTPPLALPPGPPTPSAIKNATRPGSQTVYSQSASTPLPRPKQVFETDLIEGIRNVRRQLGLPPLPARTISQLHAIARGRRADKEINAWLLANPNASWPEKFEMMNRIGARWRVTGMPGDE